MKNLHGLLLALLFTSAQVLSQNPRNVLIYTLTDTDCGPCTCMDSIYRHRVLPEYPRTIIVALHSPGFNSFFRNYQGDSLFSTFHALYDPSAFMDGLGFDTPFTGIVDTVAHRYEQSSEAPVKIEITAKTWNPDTRIVDLDMAATNLSSAMEGPFWYNVFVMESNIVHLHRTWLGCATSNVHGVPFKSDYVNDHVVRKVEFWSKGDSLVGPQWAAGQTVNRHLSIAIDSAWVPENTDIVIDVYQKADSLFKSPVQQAIRQTVTAGIGMGENADRAEILQVYPNPARDWTNIHFSAPVAGRYTLKLTDLSGKEVGMIMDRTLSPGRYNAEFFARGFQAGTYLLILSNERQTHTAKIVINVTD